tara:strand:+ start:7287 stop:7604 length:318 start_codon:yes stop_codon:yes gene_type:complete
MSRKNNDINYQSYVSYQAFSSDMPVHQINDSKWFLKFENKIPAFFINAESVFRQMPPECFYLTAERSTTMNMSNWQKQCEDYFGLTIEEIKCLTIKEEVKKQQKI